MKISSKIVLQFHLLWGSDFIQDHRGIRRELYKFISVRQGSGSFGQHQIILFFHATEPTPFQFHTIPLPPIPPPPWSGTSPHHHIHFAVTNRRDRSRHTRSSREQGREQRPASAASSSAVSAAASFRNRQRPCRFPLYFTFSPPEFYLFQSLTMNTMLHLF